MQWDIEQTKGDQLVKLYPPDDVRILVGCTPCQPFSTYAQGDRRRNDDKWRLLRSFARIVLELNPSVVSMENVVELKHHSVFDEFSRTLEMAGYHVASSEVFCPDYGVPQTRTRLVLFASRLGPIRLIEPTYKTDNYVTVRDVLSGLPSIGAGGCDDKDPMHRACNLSLQNSRRIEASTAGGTWREWPAGLRAACHRRKRGETYPSVYGRMEWDKPAPTITTQFFGYGNGRFGHPEQNRAISLREGAILQSFPAAYEFVPQDSPITFATVGRLIGNAVPVRLGLAVGRSILRHLVQHNYAH